MRIYSHYSVQTLSNVYLLGAERSREAIIIDPGCFDAPLLELVEGNGYEIAAVLLTHAHSDAIPGLKTLLKVYETDIYAGVPRVFDRDAIAVGDDTELSIGSFSVRVRTMPAMSRDAVAYHIDRMLFPGRALSAGLLGDVVSSFAHALLADNVKDKILSLDDDTMILPYQGPPTTVGAERSFNRELRQESYL